MDKIDLRIQPALKTLGMLLTTFLNLQSRLYSFHLLAVQLWPFGGFIILFESNKGKKVPLDSSLYINLQQVEC